MKRNNLFLVILVISFVTSCKMTKDLSKETLHATSLQNTDVKTEAESKAVAETKTGSTASTSSATNVNTKVTATEFSTPDANGNQHIIKQTITEQTTNNKAVADSKVNTESKLKAENKTKKADNSDYKSDVTAKADTETDTETETPGFITVIALVVGLLGIALIYYLLKRFKVIK